MANDTSSYYGEHLFQVISNMWWMNTVWTGLEIHLQTDNVLDFWFQKGDLCFCGGGPNVSHDTSSYYGEHLEVENVIGWIRNNVYITSANVDI
jgi:hypothetical protein